MVRIGFVAGLLFFVLGLLFIARPGIQNDEAMFATLLYVPAQLNFHGIPTMVMNYAGALKTWMYAPIFALWMPSAMSLRIPVLLIGAIAVALFCRLLEGIQGRRAAILGGALLATDPLFILTDCFDWGPVALQHLFFVGSLFAGYSFYRSRRRRWLVCLFLCIGLGIWDKALFLWLLSGMAIATICFFPKQAWSCVSIRNAGIAIAAFTVGALPFIQFNVWHPLETFRSNSAFTREDIPRKAMVLRDTADGSVMFGYLVRSEGEGPLRAPKTALEKASVGLRGLVGERRRDLMPWAFGCALIAGLFVRRSRAMCLFIAIAGLVAWAQMVVTKGAGGAAHHAILLWPLPQMAIAGVFGHLEKRTFAAVGVVLVASNLLVLNQYLSQFVRNGSPAIWSDATYAMTRTLDKYPRSQIFIADWGMFSPLEIWRRGQFRIEPREGLFLPGGGTKEDYAYAFGDSTALWVAHTPIAEAFAGIHERMARKISEYGYSVRMLETINDRNGRAIYEVFRLERK